MNINYLKISVLILFLFNVLLVDAQFYNTGQDDNSIKWKQIDTENFRLVYPDFAEDKAQNFANKLLWASQNVGKGLATTICKVDVIMHMESSTSNATVIWAPKRMEVHSLSPQSTYGQEWFEQLAIHEYRHVVQIDKLNQGLTKVISWVFGEMGTSAVLGAYIPLWYLEGDAVAIETALTNTGRGRQADFSMPLRAQLLDKGPYSYDKATMGSYRDYVPDHYTLGYQLVTMGKEYYGDSIWENTENFVARNPYMIVPFAHSIKKNTGLNKVNFYSSIMDSLNQKWTLENSDFVVNTIINNESNKYTSYTHSQFINDSVLFSYKTGIDDVSQFVKVYNENGEQQESRIFIPGYGSKNNISVNDSMVFWIEKRVHSRWQHTNYSVLMSCNFVTKKRKQLSKKTRYFYPIYNPKTNSVACVNQSFKGDYSLVLLSAISGEIIKEINMPSFIKHPQFNENGDKIYYYILRKNGFELVEYNLENDKQKIILPSSFNNRDRILNHNGEIYFTDDISGIKNIYKISKHTGTIARITDVPFGVGAINTWKNTIIYDNYTANGWQAALLNLDSVKVYNKINVENDLYKSYVYDNEVNIQNENIIDSVFVTSKYSKFKHLLDIHSWGPISVNVDNTEVNPGISILSQNLLSTMELSAGYEYVMNSGNNRYYTKIKYMALPVSMSLETSLTSGIDYFEGLNPAKYNFDKITTSLQLFRGFSFYKNAYSYYFQPSVRLDRVNYFAESFNQDYNVLQSGVYFSQLRRKAIKDLQPRLGQSYNVSFINTIGGFTLNPLLTFEINYYLPFIFKHSGFKTYIGVQLELDKFYSKYAFNNNIQMPRGFVGIKSEDAVSYKNTLAIPIAYPDMSISSLLYIKRVKTYLFLDHFIGYDRVTSYGADLRFDTHFLRTIAPVDFGFRYARVNSYLNGQSSSFLLLMNVSI